MQQFKRARPQQVCPTLLPLVPFPAHASYPSGHSLQSHLIANCLADAVNATQATRDVLVALADRIGHNREIAGVHYKSDTAEGKALAAKIMPFLTLCNTYNTVMTAAQAE